MDQGKPCKPWQDSDFRIIPGSTRIDYDREKDDLNRREHKYALESAVVLLERIAIPGLRAPPFVVRDAVTSEERRHEHMTIDDSMKVVFFVTTMRHAETIRVISMRRASAKERAEFCDITGFREQI